MGWGRSRARFWGRIVLCRCCTGSTAPGFRLETARRSSAARVGFIPGGVRAGAVRSHPSWRKQSLATWPRGCLELVHAGTRDRDQGLSPGTVVPAAGPLLLGFRRAVPSAARPPVLSPLYPLAGPVSVSEGTQGGGTRHKRGSQGLWWGTAVWLCTLRAPPGPPGLHEPPPPRTLCSPPAAH